MVKYPVYELDPSQEAAADKFVDSGLGSFDDWRRSEGLKPAGYEHTPIAAHIAAHLSLRASTAPGAAEHAALGPVPPELIK